MSKLTASDFFMVLSIHSDMPTRERRTYTSAGSLRSRRRKWKRCSFE